MRQPDPKNVRDALLEAGYTPTQVERMLQAANPGVFRISEKWPLSDLARYNREVVPDLLTNTWERMASRLGIAMLTQGVAVMRQQTKGDELTVTLEIETVRAPHDPAA